MTDFELFQLQHYKQRISEVTDPIAKAFLRKTYYELNKSNPDDQTINHVCPFNYSGNLSLSNNAFFTERR